MVHLPSLGTGLHKNCRGHGHERQPIQMGARSQHLAAPGGARDPSGDPSTNPARCSLTTSWTPSAPRATSPSSRVDGVHPGRPSTTSQPAGTARPPMMVASGAAKALWICASVSTETSRQDGGSDSSSTTGHVTRNDCSALPRPLREQQLAFCMTYVRKLVRIWG